MTIPIGLRTTGSTRISGRNEKRIETDQDSRASSSPPASAPDRTSPPRCAARHAATPGRRTPGDARAAPGAPAARRAVRPAPAPYPVCDPSPRPLHDQPAPPGSLRRPARCCSRPPRGGLGEGRNALGALLIGASQKPPDRSHRRPRMRPVIRIGHKRLTHPPLANDPCRTARQEEPAAAPPAVGGKQPRDRRGSLLRPRSARAKLAVCSSRPSCLVAQSRPFRRLDPGAVRRPDSSRCAVLMSSDRRGRSVQPPRALFRSSFAP